MTMSGRDLGAAEINRYLVARLITPAEAQAYRDGAPCDAAALRRRYADSVVVAPVSACPPRDAPLTALCRGLPIERSREMSARATQETVMPTAMPATDKSPRPLKGSGAANVRARRAARRRLGLPPRGPIRGAAALELERVTAEILDERVPLKGRRATTPVSRLLGTPCLVAIDPLPDKTETRTSDAARTAVLESTPEPNPTTECAHAWRHAETTRVLLPQGPSAVTLLYCQRCGDGKALDLVCLMRRQGMVS